MGPLGRREPTDWTHVERFSLVAQGAAVSPVPVAFGSMWPVEADEPQQDKNGVWWVGRNGFSGRSRGGHAYTFEAHNMRDSDANWRWFNQISEGICVSEAVSRVGALLYRKRFQPRPLYDEAQRVDEFDDTPPEEGTSVRAGFDVWRKQGLWVAKLREDHWESEEDVDTGRLPDAHFKLSANYWATNAQEILDALGTPHRDWMTILNSWGENGYPHRVRIPAEQVQWLLDRNGEAGIPIL